MQVDWTQVECRQPFLSLFRRGAQIKGQPSVWTFASRRENPQPGLQERPDAVLIVPINFDQYPAKIVLTSEFRVPIGTRELSFPAGLLEPGESLEETVKRELWEETGLELKEISEISPVNLASSGGLTDEVVQIVFCGVSGTPHNRNNEGTEDIEILEVEQDKLDELLAREDVAFSAKAWCILWGLNQIGQFSSMLRMMEH